MKWKRYSVRIFIYEFQGFVYLKFFPRAFAVQLNVKECQFLNTCEVYVKVTYFFKKEMDAHCPYET